MDWTLEDNMVYGLFFCATLTGRRGDHTPFVQAGAETFDIDAEAVKSDSRSSCEGRSGGWVSVIKCGVLWGCPPIPHSIGDPLSATARMLLLSDELVSCCVAVTKGCLDSRRRASAFDGRVSAESSRCPGSMARCARDMWVHRDEAQQVGCLRVWEGCLLV